MSDHARKKRKAEPIIIIDDESETEDEDAPAVKRILTDFQTSRKQLEQERLARQQARQQASSSSSKVTLEQSVPPARTKGKSSLQSSFPQPTVRHTYNRNFPDDADALSLSDLIGDKQTLKSALLCTLYGVCRINDSYLKIIDKVDM